MDKRLKRIREKENRMMIGVETGSTIGRFGAVLAEISGMGDGTLLDLHSYKTLDLPDELRVALEAMDRNDDFDSEETAGINFLILHHIVTLFQDLVAEAGVKPQDVDVLGLKCMEISGRFFPDDPSVLSEMTGCIVASGFRITFERGGGEDVQVREPVLQSLVEAMIEKFGLESEAREAVGVALLANEAIHHACASRGRDPREGSSKDPGKPEIHAEFYYPV